MYSMDSIIRTKKSENLLQAGYLSLVDKVFQLPDGKEETYTCVAKSDIVTIFMFTTDQKVVVTKQYRPGPETVLFDCPGGNIDHNDPVAAAKEEIEEETGYSYENLTYLSRTWHDAYDNRKRHMFIAT